MWIPSLISIFAFVAQAPSAGEGIGDPSFPSLGNLGYHATHYRLKLKVDPDTNLLEADVTMTATAEAPLKQFSVDFSGFKVSAVRLDGNLTTVERTADKMSVKPPTAIAKDSTFTLETMYIGHPEPHSTAALPSFFQIGWLPYPGGTVAVCEPDAAHTWFPCNDHPRDKATFEFEVTAPDGYTVLANGVGGPTSPGTFEYHLDQPTLTCMVTVAVGKFVPVQSKSDGTVPICSYVPVGTEERFRAALAELPRYIKFLSDRFGPYPYDGYGIVVMPEVTKSPVLSEAALETTTRPIFGYGMVSPEVLIHELAHQWFGDMVSITNWREDIWWVEGMASYSELMLIELRQGKAAYQKAVDRLATQARQNVWLRPGALSTADMFGSGSYVGGELVFAALRAKLGDEKFFQVLRQFLDRHRFGNASVKDWIEVSTLVAGKNMKPFFDAWLLGDKMPQF